jgi:hypothetical protein
MRIKFKILTALAAAIRADLLRPHFFAAERVGFISCRAGRTPDGIVILASEYHPLEDADYIDDRSVGAMMGSDAIRKALQRAYAGGVSMFHVHLHDHPGRPGFSGVDSRESAKFVPDFFNVRPDLPHGAFVLSRDCAYGMCWCARTSRPIAIGEFVFVGSPIQKKVVLP